MSLYIYFKFQEKVRVGLKAAFIILLKLKVEPALNYHNWMYPHLAQLESCKRLNHLLQNRINHRTRHQNYDHPFIIDWNDQSIQCQASIEKFSIINCDELLYVRFSKYELASLENKSHLSDYS